MLKNITIENFRSIKKCRISLQNYSLLVGANNTGKSNILKAVQLFFGEKPIKDDFSNLSTGPCPIKISVTICDEVITKEWTKDANGKITVPKLSKEHSEKLGAYLPIYIPTIEKIEDTTKTTSTNIFGKLLQTITESFDEYEQYQKIIVLINEINNDSKNPIKNIEENLKKSLKESFSSHLVPSITTKLEAQDLFKSINMQFEDRNGTPINTSDLGSGMQRTIIYELIMLLNKVNQGKKYILLYDEPEVCLHPSQQTILSYHLKHFLSKEMQVIVSSHSPIFAISGIDEIKSITRVYFDFLKGTEAYQIESLDNTKQIYQSTFSNSSEYLDVYRYINWFNHERGQLFFAKAVLLVEGLTEKGAFNFLTENDDTWDFLRKEHIYVLDCIGKFEIIRWAEIVNKLNIPFGIIHDEDIKGKIRHETMNQKIQELYPCNIVKIFQPDFENFLNIEKDPQNHEHFIILYLDDKVNLTELAAQHPLIASKIESQRDGMKIRIEELRKTIQDFFNHLLNKI